MQLLCFVVEGGVAGKRLHPHMFSTDTVFVNISNLPRVTFTEGTKRLLSALLLKQHRDYSRGRPALECKKHANCGRKDTAKPVRKVGGGQGASSST